MVAEEAEGHSLCLARTKRVKERCLEKKKLIKQLIHIK